VRLGREPDAKADFQKGAELESGESAGLSSCKLASNEFKPSRQMLEQYRIGACARSRSCEARSRSEAAAIANASRLKKQGYDRIPRVNFQASRRMALVRLSSMGQRSARQ